MRISHKATLKFSVPSQESEPKRPLPLTDKYIRTQTKKREKRLRQEVVGMGEKMLSANAARYADQTVGQCMLYLSEKLTWVQADLNNKCELAILNRKLGNSYAKGLKSITKLEQQKTDLKAQIQNLHTKSQEHTLRLKSLAPKKAIELSLEFAKEHQALLKDLTNPRKVFTWQ